MRLSCPPHLFASPTRDPPFPFSSFPLPSLAPLSLPFPVLFLTLPPSPCSLSPCFSSRSPLSSFSSSLFPLRSDVCSPLPQGLFCFGLATAYYQAQRAGLIDEGAQYFAWVMCLTLGGLGLYTASIFSLLRRDVLGFTSFFVYGSFYLYVWWYNTFRAAGIYFLDVPRAHSAVLSIIAAASFVFMIISVVYNVIIPILFCMIMITFSVQAAASASPSTRETISKGGAWFGMITAGFALYCGMAFLFEDAAGLEMLPILWTKRAQAKAYRLYPRISDRDQLSITNGVPFTGRWFGLLKEQQVEAMSAPSLDDLGQYRPPEFVPRARVPESLGNDSPSSAGRDLNQ